MAWLKSFFALCLYLVGACHPSEPPNYQASLSSSSPGISCPQPLCGASQSLETFEMARTRQDCSWASTSIPISQELSSCFNCSYFSRISRPCVVSPISTYEYEADSGKEMLASYTIFIPKELPRTTLIDEWKKEDGKTQEATKASLSVFKAKFEGLLNQRRVSPTLVTSFLEIPPFNNYSAGSIKPVVFRFVPLQAFSSDSELKIDISNTFKLPSDSTGYSCKIATISETCPDDSSCSTSATCTYDDDLKILSLKDFPVGSTADIQITIEDTPTTSRSAGLLYPSTPGLYNLPIMLEYSSTYSYTGVQPILVMPSATPTASTISLAHTSYNTSSHLKNLVTISLDPSSGSFTPSDTVHIFFPLRASHGLSAFEQNLGLCRKYDPSNSNLGCLDKYSINTNDKIPCMDKTNPAISITCSIEFGNEKSYTPTVIKASITSGSADTLNLSFLASTPKTDQFDVAVLMSISDTYEGAAISKSLTSYVANQIQGDITYGYSTQGSDFYYKLAISSVPDTSKVLIYLGSTMHKVPGNTPLHDEIYTDLDVLLASSLTAGSSGDEISFNLNKKHSLLGGMNNLYAIHINSSAAIIATSVLKIKNPYTPVITDSTTLFDKTNISFNSVKWVTFSINPNYVTDIYSKITFELVGFTLMSDSCFFIDPSGRSDTSVCTGDTTSQMIEISDFSPYTAGSSYAIDISLANPIKIKALVKFTGCNVQLKFSQYSSSSVSNASEKITYSYSEPVCDDTVTHLDGYTSELKELPISAVSCTDTSCNNYGEIRFTINIPSATQSLADYETMYVHTGGQLTQIVSGSKLRCEYSTKYGVEPLACQANQDSKDFKISLVLDSYYNADYEFIITTEGDSDGNNKGFKIPDGTAAPINIEVLIYNDTTLSYKGKVDYYPPYKLLDDFSIDFFHPFADMTNRLTIKAQYTEATGNEIFYVGIQTEAVQMNFNGMYADWYNEGTKLPCKFDSCSICECYPVPSMNSMIYPFKIKVLGLNISSKQTFDIMGIHFPAFDENQRYTFYGELWSKDGKKIAESKFVNYFYPVAAITQQKTVSSMKIKYPSIKEHSTEYYDFEFKLDSNVEYSKCWILFTYNGIEYEDIFKNRVDPQTASVFVPESESEEVWVFPFNGVKGSDYVPFKIKPPPLQTITIFSANLMCFNPGSYNVLAVEYYQPVSNSEGVDFEFIQGDSLSVTSAYGEFISGISNLAIIKYSGAGDNLYWTNVYAIRVTFSEAMHDITQEFEEIIGLSSLPQYSVRKYENSTDFLFDSPIEIRSTIKLVIPCIPSNPFTVSLKLYADRYDSITEIQELISIKHSITSDLIQTKSGSKSDVVIVTGDVQPGSTVSNFAFMIAQTINTSTNFEIKFPEPDYSLVADLTNLGSVSISCSTGFTCSNLQITTDTISLTGSRSSNDFFRATFNVQAQNINIQRGMLAAVIKNNGNTAYLLQRYDQSFTSNASFFGGVQCYSLLKILALVEEPVLPGDLIKFHDIENLNGDLDFAIVFKIDAATFDFSCRSLLDSYRDDISSFDCFYGGTTPIPIGSKIDILVNFSMVSQALNYRMSLVRRTTNGNIMLRYTEFSNLSGACDTSGPDLSNYEFSIVGDKKVVSYNLEMHYPEGESYFVLLHKEYMTNISPKADSGLEILHSFDLDRTVFIPETGSSSITEFGFSFEFGAREFNLSVELYAYNKQTNTSRLYYLTYQVYGSNVTNLSFKKDGLNQSGTYIDLHRNECFNLDMQIMFNAGRTDKISLKIDNYQIVYAGFMQVYRVDGSTEILLDNYSQTIQEPELLISSNFVNNVFYRIKNIKICMGDGYDMFIATYLASTERTSSYKNFSYGLSANFMDYSSFKWFSVSTPYQLPKSNNMNSIYFNALLPTMPSTHSSMNGKISLTFPSGVTLAEDRYYMLFSKSDGSAALVSYRCDKNSATEIECLSPFTGSDTTTWGSGSHIIRIGSPTMNKIAFSNLSHKFNLRVQLSTTWVSTSTSTIYDYSSYLTYSYMQIPSAKFEYIYKPTVSNLNGIGSIYIQTPEQVSVGSELKIDFPICDELQHNTQVGKENPFISATGDNACAIYSSRLINTSCKSYSGAYNTTMYECLNTPAYLKITFQESVPTSTNLEIFLGEIEIMETYLSLGITATLTIGSNTYRSKIYGDTASNSSSLTTTTSDLNYPSTLSTNSPVSVTVPLPSNYNLSKKGYILFSTTATSEYIKIYEYSTITAPSGRYLPPYNLGILPSSASGSSIDVTLKNVGPFSDSISDFTSEDYLTAKVYTDGSLVGNYTYNTLPAGFTKPTISVSSLSAYQANYIGDSKASIQPSNLYQFTIQTSTDMQPGSSILLNIPSQHHDSVFSTSPLCYLSENSLSLSGCYTSKDSNSNHIMTVYASGDVPQGSSITFNVQLVNAPLTLSGITAAHKYNDKSIEVASFSDVGIQLACSAGQFLSHINTCVDDCTVFDGYYGLTLAPQRCEACIANCKECSNGSSCDVCNIGYLRSEDSNNNYLCTANCDIGYYADDTSPATCKPCDSMCEYCVEPGKCTKCKDDKYLHNEGTECLTSCPAKYFQQETDPKACIPCATNCNSCSATACLQCDTDYYLYSSNQECISECKYEDKRYTSLSNPLTCSNCMANCDACTNGSTCDACTDPYVLKADNSTCLTSCPTTYFADDSRVCTSCLSDCSTCIDDSSCQECLGNFYLFDNGNSCVSSCNSTQGYFIAPGGKSCNPCSDNCMSCADESKCTQCYNDFYLHENACVSECPDGYYTNEVSGRCVEACPVDLYSDESNQRCVTSCDEFAPFKLEDLKQCWLNCPGDLYDDVIASECVAVCPEGLFSDESNYRCINACDDLAPFVYQTDKQCWKECPWGLYKYFETTECLMVCPEGMYSDESNKRCVRECDDLAPFTYLAYMQCWSECPSSAFFDLEIIECLDTCLPGRLPNESTMECESCRDYLSISDISAKYNYDYTQITVSFSRRVLPQYLTNCADLLDPETFNLFGPSVACKIQSDNRSILIGPLDSTTQFSFGSLTLKDYSMIGEGTCNEDGGTGYSILVELYNEDELLIPWLEAPTQYSLACEISNLDLLGHHSVGVSRFPLEYIWNLTGNAVTEELASYLSVSEFKSDLNIPKIFLRAGSLNVELVLDNTLGYTVSIRRTVEVVADKVLKVTLNSYRDVRKPYNQDMRVVAYISDACLDTSSITYTWDLDTTNNPGYNLTENAYRVQGSVAWLNKNTLPAGYTYIVKVHAESEEGLVGYDFLNVYVEYIDPVAIIFKADGDISVNIDLILDGSSSYDPLGMEIIYEWSCFINSTPCPFFESIFQDMSDDPVIVVKKEDLAVGVEYDFQLKITTPDNRRAYSQVLLTALDTPPGSISVYSYYRYIYEEPLVINPTVFLPSNGTFVWLQDASSDLSNIANPYIPTIQIPEFSLNPGDTYIYELSLLESDVYARAYITVRANSPPKGGSISVEPRSGNAFSTSFSFNAFFFKDEDEDYPLTYGLIAQQFDDTKLYLTLQSLDSSYVSTLSSNVKNAGIRVCDSLNSCTENYLPVDVQHQEYDDEGLIQSYIQGVEYVERIPASTILYMTNATLTQNSYTKISNYFLDYLSMLPSTERASREVFYSTFTALLSRKDFLDTERVLSYLKAVHKYAASQDDIMVAEAEKLSEIFWPAIMNQAGSSDYIGTGIHHLEQIYMNSLRHTAPTLLDHLNTNNTQMSVRYLASDLKGHSLHLHDYTVTLPEELTNHTKVLDIHTQVVPRGSNVIFSLMLAHVGEYDGLNFKEYEVPRVIETQQSSELRYVFEMPYYSSRRLLQTDSQIFRCKVYNEEEWEYTDCNISLQDDMVKIELTKVGVFELEVMGYIPPIEDDDDECDTHSAPFIIVGVWFITGVVGVTLLQVLKDKKPHLFNFDRLTLESQSTARGKGTKEQYASPSDVEIEIGEDPETGTKQDPPKSNLFIQFLKLHIFNEIFRESKYLYRVLHLIIFLNTMQLGYGLLGTFIYAFTDSDDNQNDTMNDMGDLHYPHDLRYIFMTLAIVIPVAAPARFFAKTLNTKVILVCTLLTTAMMLVSMAGILVMGAVFCMAAVHRWTAMYLIFIPLELVISEFFIMLMLFVAGKR